MTGSPQRHLADAVKVLADADRCIQQVIVDELAEGWPPLEDQEARSAAALRETCAALQGPEQAVADLDGEIGRAGTELATWQSRLEQGDVAARVEARRWVSEWEAELTVLRQKKDYAVSQMTPLYHARSKAQADLELAQAAKRSLACGMAFPYGPVGQGTRAYVELRQPRLGLVLTMADPDHPEWDAAVTQLREWCIAAMRAGVDIARDLPDFAAVAYRDMTAEMPSALDTPPDPAPSVSELVALEKAYYENMALQSNPVRASHIDDRRAARPAHAPPKPSYMDGRRLRDLGVR